MAAMNGPEFVSAMLRRKDRLDFTSTLQDLRHWPTLGQSSDAEQKKKVGNSFTGKSTATPSSLSSSSSSRLKSDSSSSTSSDRIPTDPGSQENNAPSFGEDGQLQRRNSGGKKGGKKVWEKVPKEKFWPPSQMAMQDRLRRQEGFRSSEFENRFRPPPQPAVKPPQQPQNILATAPAKAPQNPPATMQSATAPGNTSSIANQPFRNSGTGGNGQAEFGRRGKKLTGPVFTHNNNRPRIARKMQGFRPRDMTYDGDYMGRDGDGHSEMADDLSQHEYGDYGYMGRFDGSTTPDWMSSSMYYDYGMDGGYSQGYLADDYSAYAAAYYMTGDAQGGLTENGLYIPPSPMPAAYTVAPPADNVELKEMIKYQIEYYFSPENLQKDFFLRRMMANDGSVVLSLVATFQRVRALTQDFNLIIESILNSDRVELMDNFMIRPRVNPEMWPIAEGNDKATGYYYINGETDNDSVYPHSTTFDETDESATGEDMSYPEEEDDEEAEEDLSMDGSDLSELPEEVRRQLLNLKPDHHRDSIQSMSEKFLQHVM